MSYASAVFLFRSHTLEHQILGDGSIVRTLEGDTAIDSLFSELKPYLCVMFISRVLLVEWFRVIRPGGLLLVSVPDLATLSRFVLSILKKP